MSIECPHCGAEYLIDAKLTAGRSKLNGHCDYCNSSFVISAQHNPAQLSAKQIAAIAVIEGPARGQVFRLCQPRTVLGRAGADIVLRDPEVSRRHCVIEMRGATAMLVDLDTTNGTYVHGERIETYKLKHLTKFRVGASMLVFTVTNKQANQSTAPATLVTPRGRLLFR